MSKDWKKVVRKEFSNEMNLLNRVSQVDLIDFMDKELAKQRTHILARVREEVIGKVHSKKDLNKAIKNMEMLKKKMKDTRPYTFYDAVAGEIIGQNQLIREQLKKLEIISEEGKE